MAYDEQLAQRIRELLGEEPELSERKMFGGLAFLVAGHLAVAADSAGGVLLRVAPQHGADLLDEHVRPMQMRGRVMTGWLHVDPAAVRTRARLRRFVRLGVDYARTLPPKGS